MIAIFNIIVGLKPKGKKDQWMSMSTGGAVTESYFKLTKVCDKNLS
jgi:hypothetical protein